MADILIVEDSGTLRTEIEQAVRRAGHSVEAVSGGTQAIVRLQEKRFDLLLTDLMMEQGTGFEVLEWIHDHAPGLPVMICSAYSKPENLKTFLASRSYRVLRKPIEISDLVEQVHELLGEKR